MSHCLTPFTIYSPEVLHLVGVDRQSTIKTANLVFQIKQQNFLDRHEPSSFKLQASNFRSSDLISQVSAGWWVVHHADDKTYTVA